MDINAEKLPIVSIVVLNYNGLHHLKGCFDSLQKLIYPNLEVILVDNASTDGSVDFVKVNYPWVKIIQNKRNLGYAAGNNVGIASANGEYLLLLNMDTVADRICVNNLVKAIESDDDVGICACKILLLDKRNTLQHAGGKFHPAGITWDRGTYELDSGQYDKLEEVSFACGAAIFIKRNLISKIGALDPAFFMYNEDVDLCLRAWVCGFRVVYVPDAVVYHRWGWTSSKRRPTMIFHLHKNSLLVPLKNFKARTIIRWLPLMLIYKIFWIYSYMTMRSASRAKAVIASVCWTLTNLSYVLKERRKIAQVRLKSDSILKKCCASSKEAWCEYKKLAKLLFPK